MREYGNVQSRFWTRGAGKLLRGNPDAQAVALYLLSAPSSNMIGLYYLPLPVLVYETGVETTRLPEVLSALAKIGYAFYDEDTDHVWVPEMLQEQLRGPLKDQDKRRQGIVKAVTQYSDCRFYGDFWARYDRELGLGLPPPQTPSKGHGRGSEAPPKPGTVTSNQGQGQEQGFAVEGPSSQEPAEERPVEPPESETMHNSLVATAAHLDRAAGCAAGEFAGVMATLLEDGAAEVRVLAWALDLARRLRQKRVIRNPPGWLRRRVEDLAGDPPDKFGAHREAKLLLGLAQPFTSDGSPPLRGLKFPLEVRPGFIEGKEVPDAVKLGDVVDEALGEGRKEKTA